MDRLKVGLIGAGDVARSAHMPSFAANPKVEVVAIADPNTQDAQTLAEQYSIAKVVANYHEILDDPAITAVDLCVPYHLHSEITMAALNAGKHVICDKPIGLNIEEADRMIAAADERGLWLLVMLNQRFLPINVKVKKLLQEKQIGKPFLINAFITGDMIARMSDASDWLGTWDRAGGGAFFDAGTHLIDLMRYWFGEPTAVSATLKQLLTNQENKGDDNASVTLEFGNDLIANLLISYTVENEPWSEKRFIYGTEGDLSMINEALIPIFFVKDSIPSIIEVEHRTDWWKWSIDLALKNFVDTILEGAQPTVTKEDARAALKIVTAAYQSAREGRRVEIG